MAAHFLAEPQTLPGWFGKLPGIGDFAHRRLPADFRAAWDGWLQEGLMQLRLRHESDWRERYLEGPLWFFVLAPGVAGDAGWIGMMMPSVDGVGRYFPFTIAGRLRDGGLQPGDWQAVAAWWQDATQAALQSLEQDLDAAAVDALLAALGGRPAPAAVGDAAASAPVSGQGQGMAAAPGAVSHGQSLWLTHPEAGAAGAQVLTVAGLPRGARFDLLFGFDDPAEGTVQGAAQ
ncbi:type VI secretion system protein ImpM [Pseudacidovorax intermedius]|uniref:Type VI secretion system protein ImpM n=1 Tax=Pseudacidovorax intermedius TaxID=433924 RepID=A0A370FR03_9BURK|nr:type VI secretion system-associated protein TagF [Pseudacidovorax intermedius]RDI29475.1 type VI secretion system protein ImpM [Pseudacidovorax intermedius]